jgi:allophanate hydrolase
LSLELPKVLSLASIRALYEDGADPHEVIAASAARIKGGDPAAFITPASPDKLKAAVAALLASAPDANSLPLWGVPFAVKDNIDVAGMPTTCACPEFARIPTMDASVVARLIAAGAIVMGKTNLDQFATGLNGTRSPYGAPRSVFNADFISGGSSSGSAVSVAAGSVTFSLGTDTAGSGRVPAMLNNIVGIKPTPGLLSNRGMVPACESLDCITVFALSVADAAEARRVAEGYDPADPWSRIPVPRALPQTGLRIGVLAPADRDFRGDADAERLYDEACARLGAELIPIDYAPFRDTAALLYDGAWVAEREVAFAATGLPPEVLDPSVGAIFAKGRGLSALDAFRGLHKLEALKRRCAEELAKVDLLLLPTAPTTFTVAEMLDQPIAANSALGLYTNFCNFLGMAAIAVPSGFGENGLPYGAMLVAPGFSDDALLPLADQLHRLAATGSGVDREAVLPPLPAPAAKTGSARIEIAVVGAHLSGMPLNPEVTGLGGTLVGARRTLPGYRLFALPGTVPPKPGMVFEPAYVGPGVELEVWSLPAEGFARFVAAIPSPLGIGRIRLAGGGEVAGFLSESWAVAGATEVTKYGGWRAFVTAMAPRPAAVQTAS